MPHHRAGLEYRLVFPVCALIPHVLVFPEPTSSRTYIHCAFLSPPSHLHPPATENPNVPITIPLPPDPPPPTSSSISDLPSSIDPLSKEAAVPYGGIPFITRTFSHACPTRAPCDANRMHSVLNTFFQAPVSGEEKKRRLQERVNGLSSLRISLLFLSS
jgi:hypothetical protein